MKPNREPKVNNRKRMDISSLSLDKEDLRKFCDILQDRANSAAEIEVGLFPQKDQTDEQFEASKLTLRESFKLNITVTGIDGDEHYVTIEDVFSSTNFPERIKSLYVDSDSTLRYVHNYVPQNLFKIFLDFTKPKIFDLSLLPHSRTPNESYIEVAGYDATWVNGVFSELKSFIEKRASTLSKVHNHSIYDILLWILGFPLSFWFCSKASDYIENSFGAGNSFVTSALYLYTFVASLFIFRILFHYLRWVCPLVEFRSKNNKVIVHRALLTILTVSWIGQFIYDIGKWLLTS